MAQLTLDIFSLYDPEKPYSSRVRARYRVSFLSAESEQIFSCLPFVLLSVSCYIRPRYIASPLYIGYELYDLRSIPKLRAVCNVECWVIMAYPDEIVFSWQIEIICL